MLKVSIKLISAIDGSEKDWEGLIFNDGTGTPERGNYLAAFGPKGGRLKPHQIRAQLKQRGWHYAKLTGFSRKRKGPWSLLRELLEQVEDLR